MVSQVEWVFGNVQYFIKNLTDLLHSEKLPLYKVGVDYILVDFVENEYFTNYRNCSAVITIFIMYR